MGLSANGTGGASEFLTALPSMLFRPPVSAARENHPPDVCPVERLDPGRLVSSMVDEPAEEGSFWWFADNEGGGFLRRSLRMVFFWGVVQRVRRFGGGSR